MTSRFRSNWAKEGPKSTSPTFDSPATRSIAVPVDFGSEYRDYCTGDSEGKRRNGSRSARDSSAGDRNGKSRDRNGIAGSCYGDERELDNESESPDMNYYRRYRPDFRCRSAEAEESSRERRPLSGKKGASGVAPTSTSRDLVEDEADDMENPETILPASGAMTNGESSVGMTGNGSAKQVRRSAERRGTAGSSLTRERIADLSSAIHRTVDVTNRSAICTSEKSNGNSRERSARRFSRSEDNDKVCETGAAGRINETEDYGSIDRRRSRRARDRSHSPIGEVANGNGNSSSRRSETRRTETDHEKFYSPARRVGVAQDFGSMDRGSRRQAKGRSYSPEEEEDAAANGNFEPRRLERREKPTKDDEFGSTTRRSSRQPLDERAVFADNGKESRSALETNGSRGENGNGKKYSEIDNDDNSQSRKESRRKSHTHHKASPDDFDVQIHRYERALRAPRRDSDLNKKGSFRDHDSGLSRRNSVEDRHRSRDVNTSKKALHKHREAELTGRGSSEDRDQEQVSRKSSFKSRDASSTRKSSLTNRNLPDSGVINNNNDNRNNGSHHRDHSGSSRRDRDPSITRDRGRSSRANVNDEDDQDRSSWKNDRHSRPLTPPTSLEDIEAHDESRDRRSMIGVSSSSKHRYASNEDEFAHKYALDRNDYRGKAHEGTADVTQERDRFSSSTRRVVSSRSFNESRKDGSRISRIDAGNKLSTRDPLVDQNDLRDDGRNSDFSTIERNGTTVIRIRTNSESPVGHVEPRSRRRTSHQEVGAARYRKYEDEAEDEDEDDETFERDNQRRVDNSWRNYKVGQRRLWSNRDGSVQITDLDDGQPCLHCGETCPGFSPHTWSTQVNRLIMVWDDRLSVKEVTEAKKKTPRFPSRERNFAVRRRGARRSGSVRDSGVSPTAIPPPTPEILSPRVVEGDVCESHESCSGSTCQSHRPIIESRNYTERRVPDESKA